MHAEYGAKVRSGSGGLLPKDRCSLSFVKAKFSKLKKAFMLHLARKKKMQQSEAAAEMGQVQNRFQVADGPSSSLCTKL